MKLFLQLSSNTADHRDAICNACKNGGKSALFQLLGKGYQGETRKAFWHIFLYTHMFFKFLRFVSPSQWLNETLTLYYFITNIPINLFLQQRQQQLYYSCCDQGDQVRGRCASLPLCMCVLIKHAKIRRRRSIKTQQMSCQRGSVVQCLLKP